VDADESRSPWLHIRESMLFTRPKTTTIIGIARRINPNSIIEKYRGARPPTRLTSARRPFRLMVVPFN
jgi:hypothetical protein